MGRNIVLEANQGKNVIINFYRDNIEILECKEITDEEMEGVLMMLMYLGINGSIVECVYIGRNFEIINFLNLEMEKSDNGEFFYLTEVN